MIKVTVQTSNITIPNIKQKLGVALVAAGEYLRDIVNTYPPPAKKPILWTSQKQKRYVLAHVRPLPYRRQLHKNSLAKSFRLKLRRTSVELISLAPYAKYVIGEKQQQFHKVTGWVNVKDVAQREQTKVKEIITKVLTR